MVQRMGPASELSRHSSIRFAYAATGSNSSAPSAVFGGGLFRAARAPSRAAARWRAASRDACSAAAGSPSSITVVLTNQICTDVELWSNRTTAGVFIRNDQNRTRNVFFNYKVLGTVGPTSTTLVAVSGYTRATQHISGHLDDSYYLQVPPARPIDGVLSRAP